MSNSPESNLKTSSQTTASNSSVHTDGEHSSPSPVHMSPAAEDASDSMKTADSMKGDLMQGTVKWFNDAKGFGFIEHSSGRDVFVHYSVIETEGFKTLKDGEMVLYSLAEGNKGLHAGRVVRDPAVVKSAPAKAAKTVPVSEGQAETLAAKMEIERTTLKSEPDTTTAGANVSESEDSDSFSAGNS